jgi:molybdenum cofactor biosynthesis protein B
MSEDESHEHDAHDGHDDQYSRDHDGHDDHHHHDIEELGVAVLTVSSTRGIEEDTAGDAIVEAVRGDGHAISTRELVSDSYDGVQDTVDRLVEREDTDCVVTTGGTGVTPDDVTAEAVEPIFEKRLPGFGELFRTLSYEEIGTKVVGTRAVAGIADGVPVFCLPGSENAVRLGTEEIILEEAPHLAGLARRDEDDQ